jgi:phosphopantothenoylcysteine decarboxylase/phosphopantothenate--cysteine ligase
VSHFIGSATLEGLTGQPAVNDTFGKGHAMDHIHLARWADLIILCPATANVINKLAQGIADDLVTTLFLAHDFKKPFLIAPAMNSSMYRHPVTQASLRKLREMGLKVLATNTGSLACGEEGEGRLLESEQIVIHIHESFKSASEREQLQNSHSRRILITSGGTQEPIDAMRVLTNLSSGQTGATLANHLQGRGFQVDYLGATNAAKPQAFHTSTDFFSFQDLNDKLKLLLAQNEYLAVIHAAAVSDFHVSRVLSAGEPVRVGTGKISSQDRMTIELEPNFKILPRLKDYALNSKPIVVGFKFTATPLSAARLAAVEKLFVEGGVDWVVHNDLSDIDKEKGLHRFNLHSKQGSRALASPTDLAKALAAVLTYSPQKESEITL